jgi:hypothetical protein
LRVKEHPSPRLLHLDARRNEIYRNFRRGKYPNSEIGVFLCSTRSYGVLFCMHMVKFSGGAFQPHIKFSNASPLTGNEKRMYCSCVCIYQQIQIIFSECQYFSLTASYQKLIAAVNTLIESVRSIGGGCDCICCRGIVGR